jgi:hypothetical protein
MRSDDTGRIKGFWRNLVVVPEKGQSYAGEGEAKHAAHNFLS